MLTKRLVTIGGHFVVLAMIFLLSRPEQWIYKTTFPATIEAAMPVVASQTLCFSFIAGLVCDCILVFRVGIFLYNGPEQWIYKTTFNHVFQRV